MVMVVACVVLPTEVTVIGWTDVAMLDVSSGQCGQSTVFVTVSFLVTTTVISLVTVVAMVCGGGCVGPLVTGMDELWKGRALVGGIILVEAWEPVMLKWEEAVPVGSGIIPVEPL